MYYITNMFDEVLLLFRGLGLDQIMLKFLELYSDPKMLVLALNTRPSEEVCK